MFLFKTLRTFLRDKDYQDLLITTTIIIGLGGIAYHYIEGWSWIDSIYFSIITLTTIGYGDYSPQTDMGKIFTIFYILIGVGVILGFVNTVFNHYTNMKTDQKNSQKTD
ncbi:potassium channel family protein [Membranihabitans marinus]|uniref:potassium channel family protein n=1 Tax=Membranihabitans marinus TaxID=1227546 RepID=UPI001F36DF15|nr:potassium channel family protein [Membranihabitans marinus]